MQTLQGIRVVFFALATTALAACGDSGLLENCISGCESSCGAVSNVDACKQQCEDLAAEVTRYGCIDEADAVSDCLASDSCEVPQEDPERCREQRDAYNACFDSFCAAHADDAECGGGA